MRVLRLNGRRCRMESRASLHAGSCNAPRRTSGDYISFRRDEKMNNGCIGTARRRDSNRIMVETLPVASRTRAAIIAILHGAIWKNAGLAGWPRVAIAARRAGGAR